MYLNPKVKKIIKLKQAISYQLMISLMLALTFSYIFLSDNQSNGLNIKNPIIVSTFAILGTTLFVLGMIFLVAKAYEHKKLTNKTGKEDSTNNTIKEYNSNRTEYTILNTCFNYFALTAIAASYFFIVHHFIDNIFSNDSKFDLTSTKHLAFLLALLVIKVLLISSIVYTVQSKININKEKNNQITGSKENNDKYLIGSVVTFLASSSLAAGSLFLCKENLKLLLFLELISAMFIISSLSILCINIKKDIPTSVVDSSINTLDREEQKHLGSQL